VVEPTYPRVVPTATHSWDIATASGQSAELDPELAQLVLGISRNVISDEVRKLAGFDAASTVGADATATQQRATFLGRKP
jgi:hypothetical protein